MRRTLILVVRPNGRFSDVLRENGCEVINLELIRTEPVGDISRLTEIVHKIAQYDGIFLTSPAAAEIFLRHLRLEGAMFSARVYVLGERAKGVLDGSGLHVVSSPAWNTAADLIESIDQDELAGKRLLFIRGDRSIRTIPRMLGPVARIDEVVVYNTVELAPNDICRDAVRVKLRTGEIDWACFFSPSGIDSFIASFGGEDLGRVKAAAIGETTARRAEELGLNIAFVSQRSDAEDFAAGLAALIKRF